MAGVYISFPFCAQKCTYCNFASGVFPKQLEQSYLRSLISEIESTAWPWTPRTVYLGGGTPASMDTGEFEALLTAIPGYPWQEATMEAAPGAITRDQVRAWIRAGITRVSLGVQSFVDSELRRTGRKHDAAGVERDVALLRDEGIHEINIDLIAGLPQQTAVSWNESLNWIERLAPPHVSVYMLEVDEDSRLGNEIILGGERYGASLVPDDNRMADFYEEAVARLALMGLARYEISNFAQPGHESLHNLKYWKLEPYFGFGSDAHSFDGCWRWQNVESAQDYVVRCESGQSPRGETIQSSRDERLWVGLRLMQGVAITPDERDRFAEPISRLSQNGLLEFDGPQLRLTPRGVLLSNEVFAEFLETCPTT